MLLFCFKKVLTSGDFLSINNANLVNFYPKVVKNSSSEESVSQRGFAH